MKYSRFPFGLSLIAALLTACGSMPPPASEASAAAHVTAATQAAGTDLGALAKLCEQPPAVKPSPKESAKYLSTLMALPPPPPGQAFDNLFYVGATWVSAWALRTSDGIILIDALDNATEAETDIEAGLRQLGMDPAQIKYIIVTHGHGDHYGGVNHLVDKYHPRVVMGAGDWTMTETKLEFDQPQWGRPPKRDISAHDQDTVTLGDTTVTLYLTPGHTNAAISPSFEVRSAGQVHRVLLWGGTAFNFGKDMPRLDRYIASTERMQSVVQRQAIDVLISNHASFDGSLGKLAKIRAQGRSEPNPFVLGTPTVVRALTVMRECAAATRDRFALQP